MSEKTTKYTRQSLWNVVVGDCRDLLATLDDCSVDAVVCDPPYELSFMGKGWDGTGIAYDVAMWGEVLRVLKPGGHLLAFGGTRTFHRMTVAIEDAGFEIRDCLSWLYGSGFPKSLNVSKAIDKGQGENRDRQLQFTAWMRGTGITAKQIDEITGTKMGSHYTTHLTQPAIATADIFRVLRPHLPEVPEYIERLVAERSGIEWTAYKNREVVGIHEAPAKSIYSQTQNTLPDKVDITAPATPEAVQWDGWGTALKPAWEPIVMARKPFKSTVAQNVLEWGTGALNIDGSRIAATDKARLPAGVVSDTERVYGGGAGRYGDRERQDDLNPSGRWPANVMFDEDAAAALDEQSGVSASKASAGRNENDLLGVTGMVAPRQRDDVRGHDDSGGASRFFYVAKASRRDRNEGLDGLEPKREADRVRDDGVGGDNPRNRSNAAKLNHHPTVKPTALMRHLVKLVTPPDGTVLDPFTGSGSTGKACMFEGFRFYGIEQDSQYAEIARARIGWAEQQVASEQPTLL